MGREFFPPSKSSNKRPRSVSPPKEPSSNSPKRIFIPIIYIDRLRRIIRVLEAENVRDEQTVLECEESIVQRRKKIIEYQERIKEAQKQMDSFKS